MGKLDRYIISQLLMFFGFFSLTLVLVYWINQAVRLFDQVIANGQSAMVFLEFSSYIIPQIVRILLPIAGFIAAIYAANRMSGDRELVITRATGFSPWRLARPVIVFSFLVSLMIASLVNILAPQAASKLAERRVEIEANVTSRFLQEGQFLHPVKGVTFFVQKITPEGELQNIFMSDQTGDAHVVFSASKAVFFRDQGKVHLLMIGGTAQYRPTQSQDLTVTSFESFVLDVSRFLSPGPSKRVNPNHLPTHMLLKPGETTIQSTRRSAESLRNIAHQRLGESMFSLGTTVIGFAALLIGGFRRTGLWWHIFLAITLVIILKSADNFLLDIARRNTELWVLNYGGTVLAIFTAWFLLLLATRGAFLGTRLKGLST